MEYLLKTQKMAQQNGGMAFGDNKKLLADAVVVFDSQG